MTARKTEKYHVPNLERALTILELLVDHPDGLTMTQIVEFLKYPINSVFRITTTLLNRGYLQRDDSSKQFRLSRKFLTLGYASLSEHNLIENSLHTMRQLRDKYRETVLIATLAEDGVVVLDQVPGLHPFKFMVDVGTLLSLHTAAPGKAILAWLPEHELPAIINRMKFTRFNERTITDRRAFHHELETIRAAGYAVDRAEELEGVHCVGAPVFNHQNYPIAAIWITGPCDRMPEDRIPAIGNQVQQHALAISRRLGWQTGVPDSAAG